MATIDWAPLRVRLAQHGQEHLLQYVEDLSPAQAQELYGDLDGIDYAQVEQHYLTCQRSDNKSDEDLEPLGDDSIGSITRDQAKLAQWEQAGFEYIAAGKVACLLLAGGQGTRLGVAYPKGMYDIGLLSGKSLYQLQAERILRLQQLARQRCGNSDCVIPWYIMTSEHTKSPTEEFFHRHGYFGLDPSNVIMFEQNTLPCLDFNGKILLDQKHRVARSPDGNGGVYSALKQNGLLGNMESRGVSLVHVYSVDNVLVRLGDPVFTGFVLAKGAECAAKVVKKTSATEAVGLLCKRGGKCQVVEYSEISMETANKRNSDGNLAFNAGNICIHIFSLDYLKRVCNTEECQLSHHVAKKKIPHIVDGIRVIPTSSNGIKFEKFIFDAFQFSTSFAALEVLREDEFSPLKNGPGAERDSPTTCKASLFDLHYRYVLAARGKFLDDQDLPLPLIPRRRDSAAQWVVECEVSPMVSYAGEGLEELCAGKVFRCPYHLANKMRGDRVTGGDVPLAKRKHLNNSS